MILSAKLSLKLKVSVASDTCEPAEKRLPISDEALGQFAFTNGGFKSIKIRQTCEYGLLLHCLEKRRKPVQVRFVFCVERCVFAFTMIDPLVSPMQRDVVRGCEGSAEMRVNGSVVIFMIVCVS